MSPEISPEKRGRLRKLVEQEFADSTEERDRILKEAVEREAPGWKDLGEAKDVRGVQLRELFKAWLRRS